MEETYPEFLRIAGRKYFYQRSASGFDELFGSWYTWFRSRNGAVITDKNTGKWLLYLESEDTPSVDQYENLEVRRLLDATNYPKR